MNGRLLGIVAALEAEARTLGPAVRRQGGTALAGGGALLGGGGTLLAVSGMGKDLAAPAARRLVEAGATALLSFGFAGGLDPKLRAGQVLLPQEVITGDGARLTTHAEWRAQLRAAIADLAPSGGTLLSTSDPIGSVARKSELFHATGASAVDMESVAIAEVAAAHDLPFMAVRVIVDGAADALPGVVMRAAREGRINVVRLIARLAAAPGDVIGLLRLAQRYRVATRSLTAVARGAHFA